MKIGVKSCTAWQWCSNNKYSTCINTSAYVGSYGPAVKDIFRGCPSPTSYRSHHILWKIWSTKSKCLQDIFRCRWRLTAPYFTRAAIQASTVGKRRGLHTVRHNRALQTVSPPVQTYRSSHSLSNAFAFDLARPAARHFLNQTVPAHTTHRQHTAAFSYIPIRISMFAASRPGDSINVSTDIE